METASTTLHLDDGTSEEVAFFDGLFGVTHRPVGEPVGGLVVCSPVLSEFLKNNRREVLLARQLAASGYAVQRFHYRGTGNSMGDPANLAIDSMRADAQSASARLADRTGISNPTVMGTLLGAFAAAGIADAGTRMVLWDPTLDGRRYFSDLLRTKVVIGMSQGIETTTEDLELDFEARGRLDLAGFSLPRSLRDSAVGQKLELPPGDGPVLLLQLGRRAEVSRPVQHWTDKTEATGRPVTVHPLAMRETWWFHKDVDKLDTREGAGLDDELIGGTIAWLTQVGVAL